MKSRLLKSILALVVPIVIEYVIKKFIEKKNQKHTPQDPVKKIPNNM